MINLGCKYVVKIDGVATAVIAVDGERYFKQPGLSHGFIHFLDPKGSGKCLGFCGTSWFEEHAKVYNDKQIKNKRF